MLWTPHGCFEDFIPIYSQLIPDDNRWILDAIVMHSSPESQIKFDDYEDFDDYERELHLFACKLLDRYPGLADVAAANLLLTPVLDSPDLDLTVKATLWWSKVKLDDFLREYLDEQPEE